MSIFFKYPTTGTPLILMISKSSKEELEIFS